MVDFGNRLRLLRKEKGWTQGDVAIRLGVTKSVVSAYETSLRYPSYDILIRITKIFGVTSDYLLGIEKKQPLDLSGLSEESKQLVYQMIKALKREEN